MRRHRMKFENYQDAYLIDDSYGYWIIAKYQEESERDRFIHSLQVMEKILINARFYLKIRSGLIISGRECPRKSSTD